MSDERDDDDEDTKASKGSKKRFQERDDDEEEDDSPKKKRRDDTDDEDDRPRSKRKGDDADDPDDDRPKKRRRSADDGPRVKTNDGIPVLMLLAFIGSAVTLFASCVGCGWFSFGFMFGGGDGGGGGGGGWGTGNEFEVVNVSRRDEGFGFNKKTAVYWTVKAAQNPSNEYYFVVVRCGGQTQEERITVNKGSERAGSFQFPSNNGQAEVWVERRPSPFGTGKKVSNTQTK